MEIFDITEVEEIKPIKNNDGDMVVSIWCLVYNHSNYIRDALEGILAQKTEYLYEIVIVDDASTDGTTDIIREYAQKHPELFHVFLLKNNIYKNPSRIAVLNNLKGKYLTGKYVAFCEGDDFWTDMHKLQMQVSYMEEHPDCMLTMHDAEKLDFSAGTKARMIGVDEDCDIPTEELILQKRGIWPTASMIVRKECAILEGFFSECGVGDWPLQLHAATKGKIHYFGRCMSVYRFLQEGSWSSGMQKLNENLLVHSAKMVTFLQKYDRYTKGCFCSQIIERRQRFYAHLIYSYGEMRDFFDICKKFDIEWGYHHHKFIQQLCRLCKYYWEDGFVEEKLESYIGEKKHVVIMGTGYYSDKISEALEKKHIDVDGYVVSNDQKVKESFHGKRVWKMEEVPFNKKELGVVIAINPKLWKSLQDSLEENLMGDYFCPLLAEDL